MRCVAYAVVLVASLAAFDSLQAATIEVVEGDVAVNTGAGYQSVTGSTAVVAGNSVMVAPGGSAEIVYDNGCRVKVEPNALAIVAIDPPCTDTSTASESGQGYLLGALAVGGVVAVTIVISNRDDKPASP